MKNKQVYQDKHILFILAVIATLLFGASTCDRISKKGSGKAAPNNTRYQTTPATATR